VSLNEFGVEVCEMGSQAGQSMLGRAAATAGADDGLGGGPSISDKMIMKLPTSAMTSLCEIRFDRKNVVPMNVLMCRKIIAALYQVKAEANATDIGKKRQGFPDFVPDQFVVLYGIKSIAIAKVNEFFYGVREGRFRKNIKDEDEEDPLVYAFWQACHHGVPTQARMPGDDLMYTSMSLQPRPRRWARSTRSRCPASGPSITFWARWRRSNCPPSS